MQTTAHLGLAVALALAGCGHDAEPGDDEPIDPSDPSAAASFRGYAAVQDDLYAKFIAPDTAFELYRYLGYSGDELSRLVGRPAGFGVGYDVRNAKPNAMNVLVWRMMLKGFAGDLAAGCPGSSLTPAAMPPISLAARAQPVVRALCGWPNVDDARLTAAWDLVLGFRAPQASREAWLRYAHELKGQRADDALPLLWLGALLHPTFLLEQ